MQVNSLAGGRPHSSLIKPSQAKYLTGAETCLLFIPPFDRIAGLYNRHLNYKREICLR